MDGLNRTGGTQHAAQAAAVQAAQSAAAKARTERLAEETAKYTLPGAAAGMQRKADEHPPVVPMNLAQLRAWVEHNDGGIDVIA